MRGAQGFDTASQLIKTDSSERVREQTIRGLSVNKDPRVQPLLSELARTDSSARVRSEALSALARKGGPQILSILEEAIEKDPEEKVKRRAVHALSEMPQGQGIPALIRLARNKTANHKLRSEAMQWLGSSRDPRALSFVAEILAK
jgi:HEAT repeat protein